MSTWWMDCKNIKKKSLWLFEIIHIIRFEMHMDSRINLKISLGYDINYLSIWPFMGHPWFPTRKASKLTFVCFQLQLFSPWIVFNNWPVHVHLKTDNVDYFKKPSWFFLHIFAIPSSSRHEKSQANNNPDNVMTFGI